MSVDWDEARLQSYLDDQIPESLTLDYKAPGALVRDNAKIDELCKDVSSFANSEGGILIYGMVEDKAKRPPIPERLEGVTDPAITGEWIDQILSTRIHPRLEGYRIFQLKLSGGGVAYVIDVPQATTRAPHQAPTHRYYRRSEFKAQPMEDYQVRDAMRRAASPELYVALALPQDKVTLTATLAGTTTEGIALLVHIGNRAQEPAPYATITIDIDRRLHVSIAPTPYHGNELQRRWKDRGEQEVEVRGEPVSVRRLSRNYGYADEFPLFFDNPQTLEGPIVLSVTTGARERSYLAVERFYVGWSVKAPRMREQRGAMWLQLVDAELRLKPADEGPTS